MKKHFIFGFLFSAIACFVVAPNQVFSDEGISPSTAYVGIGPLWIPQRNDVGALLDFGGGLGFSNKTLCGTLRCHALETQFRLAFGANDYEQYVPYVNLHVRMVRFQPKPWGSFGFLEIGFFRNPKRMDTKAELTATLVNGEIGFQRERAWIKGGCFVRAQTAGLASFVPQSNSGSFLGLYVVGLTPSCNARLGNQKNAVDVFANIHASLSAGKNENTGSEVGAFDHLFLESWFEFGSRFQTKVWGSKIPTYFYVQADVRYHLFVNSGARTYLEGIFATLSTGLSF